MTEPIANCMKCPVNESCTWDICIERYFDGECPDGKCDLLDGKQLKDLPDFCQNKNVLPPKCPKSQGVTQ